MSHNSDQKRYGSFDLVSQRNLRLRVHQWGEGQPVVALLHGFGDTAEVWRDFAVRLPDELCVIAPDLPGHGDSQWIANGKYLHQDIASDVNAALATIGAKNVLLVGHSFGAAVAIEVARMRSDVSGLVIVDFAPFLNLRALEYTRKEFIGRMREYDSIETFVQMLENHLPLAAPTTVRRLAESAVRTTTWPAVYPKCDPALEGIEAQQVAEEAWPTLLQLQCPKLIVRGMCSSFMPIHTLTYMAQQLSNCAVTNIPQAGHAVMLDNPSGFYTSVSPFVYNHT